MADRSWLQIGLLVGRDQAAVVETMLNALGAHSVTLSDGADEPKLEPAPGATPLWSQVHIAALFDDEPGVADLVRTQLAVLGLQPGDALQIERIADRAWAGLWRDDFGPTRFGDRLWICPHGERPAAETATVVHLDPGLAFGTGRHPTTAMCLRWLDGLELAGKTVIDYGCGSGILAIAALKLGAEHAVAVDHDPQALISTADNAAANGIAEAITICQPAAVPSSACDVLVANILLGPLIELAEAFADLVVPAGPCALTGILGEQADALIDTYAPWFELEVCARESDWALVGGRRSARGATP